jgi:hypothetical protein
VRKSIAGLAFAAALIVPVSAFAATVDASLIPDGTYTVKVEKVVDAQHVTVLMPNGMETTLAAKQSLSFNNLKPNATVKLSMAKGTVLVYAAQ